MKCVEFSFPKCKKLNFKLRSVDTEGGIPDSLKRHCMRLPKYTGTIGVMENIGYQLLSKDC